MKLTSIFAAALLASGAAQAQSSGNGPDNLQETYRDWIVRCETPKPAEGAPALPRLCEMAQEISQAESKQLVLAFALQASGDGSAALTLITPFGVRLSEGIAIEIGSERLMQIAYRTCLPQGCVANAPLDGAALTRLSEAELAKILMTADAGGQPLAVDISLNGFAAAWARLQELKG